MEATFDALYLHLKVLKARKMDAASKLRNPMNNFPYLRRRARYFDGIFIDHVRQTATVNEEAPSVAAGGRHWRQYIKKCRPQAARVKSKSRGKSNPDFQILKLQTSICNNPDILPNLDKK